MSFRSKPVVIGTTDTDIYEVPVTLSAVVVLGIHNVDPSPTPSFTLKYYKQSTDTTTTLGTITFESSPSFKYEVPFSMEPGDKLIGSASAENAVAVTPFITDNAAIPTAVGFNPIGEWNSGTTYGRNDIVRVEGGGSPYIPGKTYISLQDNNQNQNPETEAAYWMVLVEDGPRGPAGDLSSEDIGVTIQPYDAGTLTQSVLFGFVDPTAAAESSNEVTLDVGNGNVLFFTETLGDDAEVQVPVNMPDGATIYFLVDPDGNELTWASGFEGSNNELPSPTDETLYAIVRNGSRYLVIVAGENFGDGS